MTLHNEYTKTISGTCFDDTPKSVFAAITISLLTNYVGINFKDLEKAIYEEWDTLHKNGIIPQPPKKTTICQDGNN